MSLLLSHSDAVTPMMFASFANQLLRGRDEHGDFVHWDKDRRFMALRALTQEIGSSSAAELRPDADRIRFAFVRGLKDTSTDVQTECLRGLGVVIPVLPPAVVTQITRDILAMTPEEPELSYTALRSIAQSLTAQHLPDAGSFLLTRLTQCLDDFNQEHILTDRNSDEQQQQRAKNEGRRATAAGASTAAATPVAFSPSTSRCAVDVLRDILSVVKIVCQQFQRASQPPPPFPYDRALVQSLAVVIVARNATLFLPKSLRFLAASSLDAICVRLPLSTVLSFFGDSAISAAVVETVQSLQSIDTGGDIPSASKTLVDNSGPPLAALLHCAQSLAGRITDATGLQLIETTCGSLLDALQNGLSKVCALAPDADPETALSLTDWGRLASGVIEACVTSQALGQARREGAFQLASAMLNCRCTELEPGASPQIEDDTMGDDDLDDSLEVVDADDLEFEAAEDAAAKSGYTSVLRSAAVTLLRHLSAELPMATTAPPSYPFSVTPVPAEVVTDLLTRQLLEETDSNTLIVMTQTLHSLLLQEVSAAQSEVAEPLFRNMPQLLRICRTSLTTEPNAKRSELTSKLQLIALLADMLTAKQGADDGLLRATFANLSDSWVLLLPQPTIALLDEMFCNVLASSPRKAFVAQILASQPFCTQKSFFDPPANPRGYELASNLLNAFAADETRPKKELSKILATSVLVQLKRAIAVKDQPPPLIPSLHTVIAVANTLGEDDDTAVGLLADYLLANEKSLIEIINAHTFNALFAVTSQLRLATTRSRVGEFLWNLCLQLLLLHCQGQERRLIAAAASVKLFAVVRAMKYLVDIKVVATVKDSNQDSVGPVEALLGRLENSSDADDSLGDVLIAASCFPEMMSTALKGTLGILVRSESSPTASFASGFADLCLALEKHSPQHLDLLWEAIEKNGARCKLTPVFCRVIGRFHECDIALPPQNLGEYQQLGVATELLSCQILEQQRQPYVRIIFAYQLASEISTFKSYVRSVQDYYSGKEQSAENGLQKGIATSENGGAAVSATKSHLLVESMQVLREALSLIQSGFCLKMVEPDLAQDVLDLIYRIVSDISRDSQNDVRRNTITSCSALLTALRACATPPGRSVIFETLAKWFGLHSREPTVATVAAQSLTRVDSVHEKVVSNEERQFVRQALVPFYQAASALGRDSTSTSSSATLNSALVSFELRVAAVHALSLAVERGAVEFEVLCSILHDGDSVKSFVTVDNALVEVLDLGPFKSRVDRGEPLREAAWSLLGLCATKLRSCAEQNFGYRGNSQSARVERRRCHLLRYAAIGALERYLDTAAKDSSESVQAAMQECRRAVIL